MEPSAPVSAKPSPASPVGGKRSAKPATKAVAAASNAAVVEQVLPEVMPKAAESIHGQFLVRVRVSVDASGAVSNADFDARGPSNYFAKAALEAARKWKFKAGAPSTWVLQFRFTRDGTEATPERVGP